MPIVRFLDKKNNCYELSSPENPMLIYLNDAERKKILNTVQGECVIFANSNDSSEQVNHLNTTDQPKLLK